MKGILFNDNWKLVRVLPDNEKTAPVTVTLPYDAMLSTQRSPDAVNGTRKAFFENGVWEYHKRYRPEAELKGKCIFLEFEGVYCNAMIYINGSFLASHPSGYTRFHVEITDLLRFGEDNYIKVVATTGDDSRWYTGAGIYRDVKLYVGEALRFRYNGLKLRTLAAEKAEAAIELRCHISNDLRNRVAVRCTVTDPRGCVVHTETFCGQSADFKSIFKLENPALWDDEHPVLYHTEAELLFNGSPVDSCCADFGIRTVSISAGEGLRINGRTVKLRGACIHHDNGVIGANTYYSAEYRRLKRLKEAGFNAVRIAHHPAGRHVLDACDRLGLYVLDEAFDAWQIHKTPEDYARCFGEWWQRDMEAMVDNDYNHPSVIMYSIGNEIGDLAYQTGCELAARMTAFLHRADPSRYTTSAINGIMLLIERMGMGSEVQPGAEEKKGDVNETMTEMENKMAAFCVSDTMDAFLREPCRTVDVAGYNYMHVRYAQDRKKYPNRTILGTESYPKDTAEIWAAVSAHTNVLGDFTWTGWDYLGETGIGRVYYGEQRPVKEGFYGPYPCITAGCADFDITGVRQPQSYYREIVFGRRKEPYLCAVRPGADASKRVLSPWSFTDAAPCWEYDGAEGLISEVHVFSADAEVELFLNGVSCGKQAAGAEHRYEAVFRVPYAPGRLSATGSSGAESALVTPGRERCLRAQAEQVCVSCGERELIYVNITMEDSSGNLHAGATDELLVETAGPVALLGFGNGAESTEESYTDRVHSLCRGHALAVLRPEQPGNATVTVRCGEQRAECNVEIL